MKLTERQKKFAEYYAQCGNITESAIKSGYSKKYAQSDACKILENPSVEAYLQELTEKSKTDRILTATQRQEILSNIAVNEEENSMARVRAIDTLNKMTCEYIKKVEVTSSENSSKLDDILSQLKGDTS